MYYYTERNTVSVPVVFIFVAMATMIEGIKFLQYNTGFNQKLSSSELQSSRGNSRLACGVLCEKKVCEL